MDQTIYACNDGDATARVTYMSRGEPPFIDVSLWSGYARSSVYLSMDQARAIAKGLNDALYEHDGPAVDQFLTLSGVCDHCGEATVPREWHGDATTGAQWDWAHYVEGAKGRWSCAPKYDGGSPPICTVNGSYIVPDYNAQEVRA